MGMSDQAFSKMPTRCTRWECREADASYPFNGNMVCPKCQGSYGPFDTAPKSPQETLNAWKVDTRPQRGWWAPGEYVNHCRICACTFIGDKRAGHCADCAYALPEESQATTRPTQSPIVQAADEMEKALKELYSHTGGMPVAEMYGNSAQYEHALGIYERAQAALEQYAKVKGQ
jgi:hypothetical protein